MARLDWITGVPFDPLAPENVGLSLALEMLQQPLHSFPVAHAFHGAGVYAIHYNGTDEAYRPLVDRDAGRGLYPVYVGSALRERRQGFSSKPVREAVIRARLLNHQRSMKGAKLDLADFQYRYLLLGDAHVILAESVLIAAFRPAWNGLGFGANGVGEPRMSGRGSVWDALHPGRSGRPAALEESRQEAKTRLREAFECIGKVDDDPKAQRMVDLIIRLSDRL